MSLASQVISALTRVATEFKTVRALLGDKTVLVTTDKSTLVAAINESRTLAGAAAVIDDTATSATGVWSSTKTAAEIAALVESAPALLNTLNELAAALNDDPNFAVTVTSQISAVDTRVTQLSAAIGDTTTDFVAAFEAALV